MTQVTTDMRFASAVSDEPGLDAALPAVTDQLRTQHSGAVDVAFVFTSSHHAHGFERIAEHLGAELSPKRIVAVTCEGVIARRREVEQGPGLSVLAGALPGATVDAAWLADFDAKRTDKLKAAMLLADPFSTPMHSVLPDLSATLPNVVGGMASGARKPGGNRLMIDGEVRDAGGIAVTFGGDVQVDITLSQGCRPIGKPLVITKAKRNIILELAGRKALDLITETIESLTDADRDLVRRGGLLVGRVIDEYKPRFGRGDFLIRNIVGYDEQTGYVAVSDTHIRTGQTVQFHVRDQQTAREDFALLLEMQKVHGPAAGALAFSCNGRGIKLFDQPHADANMIHDALGDVPLAGFFAAGEIGPVGGHAFLHGHTVSLMVFRPAAT